MVELTTQNLASQHSEISQSISSTAIPALEVKDLYFSFNNQVWALQDVSVTIQQREFVGIIGPNGGGKTTFVKLLLGVLKPNKGEIKIMGKSIRVGRKLIGYFPQIRNIDADFPITVKEIIMGARLQSKIMNFVSKKDRDRVDEVMKMVDIHDLQDRKLNELSGGQRNRVFLARALACDPEILILDEPMAGLDVSLQKMFFETLKKLNNHLTIVIIDHNINLLEEYVDGFICLNRCVAHGSRLHHRGDPELLEHEEFRHLQPTKSDTHDQNHNHQSHNHGHHNHQQSNPNHHEYHDNQNHHGEDH